MNTEARERLAGRLKGSFFGFSIRARITLAILLAFILMLPVVFLSIFYFSNLLSSMQIITERDVRIARTATNLTFTMQDIQRLERNYQVFGSSAERENIVQIMARADSLIESARLITPADERGTIDALDRALDNYRRSFGLLVSYLNENPPETRLQRARTTLTTQFDQFEAMFRSVRMQLEKAAPAQQDSILAAAEESIDAFSIDQIVAFNGSAGAPAQASAIQVGLDTARQNFLQTSQRLAAMNWENLEQNKDKTIRAEARAKRNIIFILILTIFAGLFMVILLPGYIIKPITNLSTMLRRAASGELDVYAPVNSHDEIGALAAAYNQAMDRIRTFDELKSKKIASQKRSIERLIDLFNTPICILSKNLVALYYNTRFAGLFGTGIPQKTPENGLDITKIPEMRELTEQLRKKTAQAGGDFRLEISAADGSNVALMGRPVRNVTLNLETIIVVGAGERNGKDT